MSSSTSPACPARNRLGQAVSSALVLVIAAPHVSAGSAVVAFEATSAERKAEYAKRLPDIGCDSADSRSAESERLLGEALAFLSSGVSTEVLADRAANAALQAGTDALREAGIPFLGSLQGGVVYNTTLRQLDFDLLSVAPIHGNGSTGSQWLLQLGAHDLRDRTTANAGLVYRWLDPEGKYLLGSNLFYDHDFDGGAKRLGVGVEAANETLRAFANTYAPLGGWVDSPDIADREERAARGFDLGFIWTPRELSMLDLQLKGAKWKGDGVDVFGNGETTVDPAVWSARATVTPVQALRLGLEHSRVAGGQQDFQAMLSWVFQFGVPLAQQWAWTTSGARNDLRFRALSPVEREKRIVVDTREKSSAPVFANGSVVENVLEGEGFTHAINVAGGSLPLVLTLSGPDAAQFTLSGTMLTLPAQQFDSPADAGADNTYNVTVVAVDARGRQATQHVAISVQSAAPAVRNAVIDGEATVGTALTLGYVYFSPLDEPEDLSALRIQWFRRGAQGDADIAGATGMQYVPVAEDVGYAIGARVAVQSTSGRRSPMVEAVSGAVQAAQGAGDNPPTASPVLHGTVAIGSKVTGLVGYADADGDAEGTHLYRWYRASNPTGSDAVEIVGASSSSYSITAADAGHYLVFEVTPRSATGTPDVGAAARVVTHIAVPALVMGSAPTATPTLQGAAKVGSTLTGLVGYADAENDPAGVHEYRWYRATDSAGAQRTLLPGATSATYSVRADDVAHYLVFEVTPRSASGAPDRGVATRVVSDVVTADALPTATPTVSLSGARVVGNAVLNADAGFSDPNDVEEGTHQFQWFRADDAAGTGRVAIANATSATYTPVAADQGKHLVVQVTPKTVDGVTGEPAFSNSVSMPYGQWGYRNVIDNGERTNIDIIVTGRTSPAGRIRVEVGSVAGGTGYIFWTGFIEPGKTLYTGLDSAVEYGTTWSGELIGTTDGNGTWRFGFLTFRQGNRAEVAGGINYVTIEFLGEE